MGCAEQGVACAPRQTASNKTDPTKRGRASDGKDISIECPKHPPCPVWASPKARLSAIFEPAGTNAVLPCAPAIADHTRVNRFLKAFGIVLLLSGLAHSAGVARFYLIAGVPDANRVLLDVWVAEGLLLGGSLYLAACSAVRAGQSPRVLTVFGSLTIISFTAPMTPVLISRAPIHFVMLTVIYLLLSVVILALVARPERTPPP